MAERTPRSVIVDGMATPEVHAIGTQANELFAALFKGKDTADSRLSTIETTLTAAEVTGSKGGNAALTSLIAVLVAKGIITDSTT